MEVLFSYVWILSPFLFQQRLFGRSLFRQRFFRRRCGFALPGGNGSYQALWAGADQVLPVGFDQSFFYQIIIFGVSVLDQCPLHGFLMGIGGYIHLVHCPGVKTCVVHDCGKGRGGGIEILHLLRIVTHLTDVLCQLDGFFQGGAGVAGHQIGNKKLLHAILLI